MANDNSGGIGICGVLFVVFLVLKLCGVIAWSWWWVAAPLWVPFSVFIVAIPIILLVYKPWRPRL